MSDHVFPDLDVLKAMVKSAIGSLVDVNWVNDVQSFVGFNGLDVNGFPITGLPTSPPATNPATAGRAVTCTLKIVNFVEPFCDDIRREFGMATVVSEGTLPPTISLSGSVALTGVDNIDVECTDVSDGVARGLWKGRWSSDRGVAWHTFTSGATVVMGTTGLTLEISTGNANVNNKWSSGPVQIVTNIGVRHFTLNVKIEGDGVNVWAVAERLRMYLYFQSTRSELAAAHIALRECGPVQDFSGITSWDNRAINAAVIEVFLTYGSEMKDVLSSGLNNWIETVNTNNRVPYVPPT